MPVSGHPIYFMATLSDGSGRVGHRLVGPGEASQPAAS